MRTSSQNGVDCFRHSAVEHLSFKQGKLENRSFSRGGNKAWRGFTLIELLIVIAIASILAVLGLSSFRVIQQGRYNATVDSISRQLEFAQSYAQGNGTYTWVGIQNDPAGGIDLTIWASRDGTIGSPALTATNRILLSPTAVYQSAQLTAYTNPDTTIVNINTGNLATSTPFQASLAGGAVSFTQVIQFAPSGAAAISSTQANWIEFPLQKVAGTTAVTPSVTTYIRVSGLTGRMETIKQ